MRPHAPASPTAVDRRLRVAAVVGDLGGERAATWLAAALASGGRPIGLLTESCEDDGELCRPRVFNEQKHVDAWAERCVLGGVRQAVVQAAPHTPVADPTIVCVTTMRGDVINPAGERVWSSVATHRAALRRCAGLSRFSGTLVVNADDPDGTRLAASHRGPLLTYGESDAADLRVEPLENHLGEQAVLVTHGGDSTVMSLRVAGSAARRDAAAALATAFALTHDLTPAARAIELAGPAGGRLEPVTVGQDFGVWADAAIRPAELAEALEGVSCGEGRLLAVIRLAEDRLVAQQQLTLVGALADRAFAYGAIDDLAAPPNVSLVEDELAALAVGVGLADSGDAVLVAGRRGQEAREAIEALLHRRLACDASGLAA